MFQGGAERDSRVMMAGVAKMWPWTVGAGRVLIRGGLIPIGRAVASHIGVRGDD